MKTFLFSPPITLLEEGTWLLAVTIIEATNSLFNISNENNSFSVSTPGHWNSEDGENLLTI